MTTLDDIIFNLPGYDQHMMHIQNELRSMNRVASTIREGVMVGVGCFRGKMDCAIALNAQVPYYAVDPHLNSVSDPGIFSEEDRVYWTQNVMAMGLMAKIRPINLTSLQAATVWNEPISLLWIDASHDYQSVHDDLAAWLPHLMVGGFLAMHDVPNSATEVNVALDEVLDYFEIVEAVDLTVIARLKREFGKDLPIVISWTQKT